jgi:hypothetical protein
MSFAVKAIDHVEGRITLMLSEISRFREAHVKCAYFIPIVRRDALDKRVTVLTNP